MAEDMISKRQHSSDIDELALDLLHAMRPDVPREHFEPFLRGDKNFRGEEHIPYLHVSPEEIRRIVEWVNARKIERGERR